MVTAYHMINQKKKKNTQEMSLFQLLKILISSWNDID